MKRKFFFQFLLAILVMAGASIKTASADETLQGFKKATAAAAADGTTWDLTDARDGKVYKAIKFPNNAGTWLFTDFKYTEGLTLDTDYKLKEDEGEEQGTRAYYKYDVAVEIAPAGWRLATEEEWRALPGDIRNGGPAPYGDFLWGVVPYSESSNGGGRFKPDGTFWDHPWGGNAPYAPWTSTVCDNGEMATESFGSNDAFRADRCNDWASLPKDGFAHARYIKTDDVTQPGEYDDYFKIVSSDYTESGIFSENAVQGFPGDWVAPATLGTLAYKVVVEAGGVLTVTDTKSPDRNIWWIIYNNKDNVKTGNTGIVSNDGTVSTYVPAGEYYIIGISNTWYDGVTGDEEYETVISFVEQADPYAITPPYSEKQEHGTDSEHFTSVGTAWGAADGLLYKFKPRRSAEITAAYSASIVLFLYDDETLGTDQWLNSGQQNPLTITLEADKQYYFVYTFAATYDKSSAFELSFDAVYSGPPFWDISAGETDAVFADLSEDSTLLTISGKGSMENFLTSYDAPYVGGGAPWVVDLEFDADGKVTNYTILPFASKIKTIIIEEGVTNLGASLAWGVTGLESISLPSTLESIGGRAFSAHRLTQDTIKVPDKVKSIGGYAFEGGAGNSVKVVILPETLENISIHAFDGMPGIEAIYSYASTPPTLPNSTTFNGVNKDAAILYVPAGTVDAYKAADYWKEFKNIEEITEEGEIPAITLPYTSGSRKFADKIIPSLTGSYADKGNDGIVAVKFTTTKSGWFVIESQGDSLYLFKDEAMDAANLVDKGDGSITTAKKDYPAGTYYLAVDNKEAITAETTYNLTVIFHGTGVVNADRTVKSVISYDLLGRQVPDNATGIVIKRITYDDGSVETKKVYVKN